MVAVGHLRRVDMKGENHLTKVLVIDKHLLITNRFDKHVSTLHMEEIIGVLN